MRFFISLSVIFISLSLLSSCKKQSSKDHKLILEYIEEHNLDAIEAEEGVFVVIDVEGNGENPTINNKVEVHYEGFLLDGNKFDSSIDRGSTATFPLASLIRGWQIGIPYLKKGGRGRLLIPSALGYGSSGSASIPPNSVLIFDIQLFDVI